MIFYFKIRLNFFILSVSFSHHKNTLFLFSISFYFYFFNFVHGCRFSTNWWLKKLFLHYLVVKGLNFSLCG